MYQTLNELIPAMEEFRANNGDIISQWEEMCEEQERLEEQMKMICKETGVSHDIGIANFQYVSSYRKWIDYDKAYNAMKNKEQRLRLGEISKIEKVVDMKKFIELTREGVFPEEARVQAYREEELSPKILIKYKKDEEPA
jgi:hypothetical protein